MWWSMCMRARTPVFKVHDASHRFGFKKTTKQLCVWTCLLSFLGDIWPFLEIDLLLHVKQVWRWVHTCLNAKLPVPWSIVNFNLNFHSRVSRFISKIPAFSPNPKNSEGLGKNSVFLPVIIHIWFASREARFPYNLLFFPASRQRTTLFSHFLTFVHNYNRNELTLKETKANPRPNDERHKKLVSNSAVFFILIK